MLPVEGEKGDSSASRSYRGTKMSFHNDPDTVLHWYIDEREPNRTQIRPLWCCSKLLNLQFMGWICRMMIVGGESRTFNFKIKTKPHKILIWSSNLLLKWKILKGFCCQQNLAFQWLRVKLSLTLNQLKRTYTYKKNMWERLQNSPSTAFKEFIFLWSEDFSARWWQSHPAGTF